jgi:hypothetical protein
MLFLIPLLVCSVAALRRLSLSPCDVEVFALGQGTPTAREGITFGPDGIMPLMDARISASPKGGELLAKIPSCLKDQVRPIKFIGINGLKHAVKWLEKECMRKDCVVYTSIRGSDEIANMEVQVRIV